MRFLHAAVIFAVMLMSCFEVADASSVSDVKAASLNTPVSLQGALVTASFFGDVSGRYSQTGFAIEDPSLSAGIRVVSSQSVSPGDAVSIQGITTLENGEIVIEASQVTVTSSNNAVPKAVGMSGRASGGGGIEGIQAPVVDDYYKGKFSVGINSNGMLVKLWGKVTASAYTGNYDGYFYIDDGSSLQDGSGNKGIKCRPASNMEYPLPLPDVGDYVVVTGVMGVDNTSGVSARYLWTQSVQTVVASPVPVTVSVVEYPFGSDVNTSLLLNTDMDSNSMWSSNFAYSYGAGTTCISVYDYPKKWRGTSSSLNSLYYLGETQKMYGGEYFDITYSLTSINSPGTSISVVFTDGTSIVVASGSSFVNDGKEHTTHCAAPSNTIGKRISKIQVIIDNPQAGTTTLCLKKFAISRDGKISNRIDADTILKTPPHS